jgi:hypothetical protein
MEILIYRNDESEETATVFTDAKEAITHMKLRASKEGKEWYEYIIKCQ